MSYNIRSCLALVLGVAVLVGAPIHTFAADLERAFLTGSYPDLLDDLEAQYLAGELTDPESFWALSSLYLLVGDREMTLEAAERAFEMEDPKTTLTYRRMGILTFQVGRYYDAVEYLRTAAQMDKYDHWARYHLVLSLDYLINRQSEFRLIGEYEKVLLELLELERMGLRPPSLAYYYFGRYFAEKENVVEAKYYYGQFVKSHDPMNQEEARYMINGINYLKAYD